MNKLLLTTLVTSVMASSTSSFAYFCDLGNSSTTANDSHGLYDSRGLYYLKVNAGALWLNKVKDHATQVDVESKKPSPFIGVGVGYYGLENVRAELTYDYLVNPLLKSKKDATSDVAPGQTILVKHKPQIMSLLVSGYIDIFEVSTMKLIAGAGIGVARVKEKVKYFLPTGVISASSKAATNFAYHLTVGVASEIMSGITAELSYSWRDYGKGKSKSGIDFGPPPPTVPAPVTPPTTPPSNIMKDLGKAAYKGHHIVLGLRYDL